MPRPVLARIVAHNCPLGAGAALDTIEVMDLAELDENERAALVALLDHVIAADQELTDDEEKSLKRIIDTLGPDAYAQAVDRADETIRDDDDLRRLLQSITRQSAREAIYTAIMDVALANVVLPQEAPLLEWLAATWDIQLKAPPPVGQVH